MTPRSVCDLNLTKIEHENAEQDYYVQLKQIVSNAFNARQFKKEFTDLNSVTQTLGSSIHVIDALEIALAHKT